MTWNPLRKSHLSQRPTPAPPLLTQSEDRDLDIAVQRLIHVEETVRKLTKEAKRYLESLTNLDRSDQRLSTNLITCDLAHVNDEFRRTVEDYHSVTTQFGQNVRETTLLLHKTFVEPLKKLLDELSMISTVVARREELVASWKSSHNRLKKLQEKRDKTANHVAKLERERKIEETSGRELRSMHSRLLVEFPWLLDKRLEYAKPSVHALIMIQLDYYGNATKLFTQLMRTNVDEADSPSRAVVPDEEYRSIVDGHINRIKSLTIVKNP